MCEYEYVTLSPFEACDHKLADPRWVGTGDCPFLRKAEDHEQVLENLVDVCGSCRNTGPGKYGCRQECRRSDRGGAHASWHMEQAAGTPVFSEDAVDLPAKRAGPSAIGAGTSRRGPAADRATQLLV